MFKALILSFFFPLLAVAEEIHPQFKLEGMNLTVSFKQVVNEKTYGIKTFYQDLKVPEEHVGPGKDAKSLSLDDHKFKIYCEKTDNKVFQCDLKTTLKSHVYRNVLLLPSNDLAITFKTKLAWEFMDLTWGQSQECFHKFYADNFYFSVCPNTVDLMIHPSKEQGFF